MHVNSRSTASRSARRSVVVGATVLGSLLTACAQGESARPAATTLAAPAGSAATATTTPPTPDHFAYPSAWDSATELPFAPPVAVDTPVIIVETTIPEAATPASSMPESAFARPVQLDGDVLFASGTATITEAADADLNELALLAVAQLRPEQVLFVDGHVDDRGTPTFNDGLAADRTQAVVDRLLRDQPTLEGRIVGRPHGEDELLDPTCHGDCSVNRRVVISAEG